MQPRVDLISLGVRSVDASRRFYVDGLGWPVHREVPGEVLFIQANHGLILSLWDAGQMHGYTGYFADPDGYRWEVAFNPDWAVDGGGKVTL